MKTGIVKHNYGALFQQRHQHELKPKQKPRRRSVPWVYIRGYELLRFITPARNNINTFKLSAGLRRVKPLTARCAPMSAGHKCVYAAFVYIDYIRSKRNWRFPILFALVFVAFYITCRPFFKVIFNRFKA